MTEGGDCEPDGGTGLRIRLLGTVRASFAGRDLKLSGVRPKSLLAALLLYPGQTLPKETVIEAVWDGDPPLTADALVADYLSRLRTALAPAGEQIRLRAMRPGFRAELHPLLVDAHQLRDLIRRAERDRDARDDDRTAALLRQALDLWPTDTPALADLESAWLRAEARRLRTWRLDALERLARLHLDAGEPDRAAVLLRDTAPSLEREKLTAVVIETLLATGERTRGEALARRTNETLTRRNTQPGPVLRAVLDTALGSRRDGLLPQPARQPSRDTVLFTCRDGSAVVRPAGAAAGLGGRAGLPRDISVFTGRERQFAALLASVEDSGGGVLAIHAVDGLAGVGKSAFALHAAHRLAGRFPDGQVLIRLHAHTPGADPVGPQDALAELLLGDGLAPSELPDTLTERMGRWRGRTAGRRMLLVLDDAVDAAQVEPLLPSAPGALVLVTSRQRIDGLGDVVPLDLGVLDDAEAARLIVRTARRPDLDEQDRQVARLAALCGNLPLALVITAARLATHPSWTTADLVRQLETNDGRLRALSGAQRSVAAALERSYHDLTGGQTRLLRLLGAHPGTEYEPEAAGALLGTDRASAHSLLAGLEEHRLLDETTPGRYRMHDLVREYAADQARRDPDETGTALARLLQHYTAQPRLVAGGNDAPQERALPWLRTERENLLACIEYGYRAGRVADAVHLSRTVAFLLSTDGPWSEATAVHERAAQAARDSGDHSGQAHALYDLASVHLATGEYAAAKQALTVALELCQELDDRAGHADALYGLGRMHRAVDEYVPAREAYTAALELYRELGDRGGQANILNGLGQLHGAIGESIAAQEAHSAALELYRELGDSSGQADALNDLGSIWLAKREYAAAEEALTAALELFRRLGNRRGEAYALDILGLVRLETGEHAAAEEAIAAALALFRQLGHRSGQAYALTYLGTVRRTTRQYAAAEEPLTAALELFRQLGDRLGQAYAFDILGSVGLETGQLAAAEEALTAAFELYRRLGNRGGQASALKGLRLVKQATGDPAGAQEFFGGGAADPRQDHPG